MIVAFICSEFVCLHSSSLLMTFGQRILSMHLNHLLTKTWMSFSIVEVIFQVSQPYSKTEIQFVFKNRNFKFLVSCAEFQMLFNEIKGWRAFSMRLLTSRSAPPSIGKMLPRLQKLSVSLIDTPSIDKVHGSVVLIRISFVLIMFTCSPTCPAYLTSRRNDSSMSCDLCAVKARSSAKSISYNRSVSGH